MDQSFNCTNCGGALDYGGSGRTMKCPYCGTTVEVPEALWGEAEQVKTGNQWKTYIIIFLVVTVGIPTCLSLLGMALGIGGGIFAAIIPFVLRIFLH